MKFNWGTGIFTFIIIFIIACISFVIYAFSFDVNLVHEEYYQKGVNYDEEISRKSISSGYINDIYISNTEELIKIDFSERLESTIDSGIVYFYKPSNKLNDVKFLLQIDNGSMQINKIDLSKGRYIVKTTWFSKGNEYKVEKEIIIK